LESLEKGQLEHHGRHFAIKSDPVENFNQTVVCQCCVGGVTPQKMAVAFDDIFVSKSNPRWHTKTNESNYFHIQKIVKIR
jgi:hypothetical protein